MHRKLLSIIICAVFALGLATLGYFLYAAMHGDQTDAYLILKHLPWVQIGLITAVGSLIGCMIKTAPFSANDGVGLGEGLVQAIAAIFHKH